MSHTFTPEPTPDELTAPFWAAGLEGKLRLQQCVACGHIRFPLSTICPDCLSPGTRWVDLSGRGSVQSFIRFHRAYDPSWADEVPYVTALIELDEGPVIVSNVVGLDSDQVAVGDPVDVVFELRTDEAALPQFRRRANEGATS